MATRPKNLWRKRGVYYCRVTVGGVRRAVSLRTKDEAEALRRRAELAAAGGGVWEERTVREAVEAFLEASALRGLSEGTMGCYRQKARQVSKVLGGRKVGAFRRQWSFEYVTHRRGQGVSQHTVHKELVVLRGALREAAARGWLGPGMDVRELVPRVASRYRPRTRCPTAAEVRRLVSVLAPRRVSYVLLAWSGLRKGEVERAKWRDLEGEALYVRGTKTRWSRRTVPLAEDVVAHLRRVRGAAGPDEPIAGRWANVVRDLEAACRRAGIERLTPNDLRRGAATALRLAGAAPETVARYLGHAPGSRVTLEVYARTMPAELRAAVERLPAVAPGPSTAPTPSPATCTAPSSATCTGATAAQRLARCDPDGPPGTEPRGGEPPAVDAPASEPRRSAE